MPIKLQNAVPTLLREQVVDILRTAITECRFEPGGRLIERELCEALQVSRSTVREGLRQLEAEGLVTITPNRGPMVTVLEAEEAREVYAIRATLEGMASAAAAERVDAAQVEQIAAQVIGVRAAREEGNFAAVQQAKTLFYDSLLAAAGNRQLERTLKQLRARGTLLRGLDVFREARMNESVRGAAEILAAVRSRDPDAARLASIGHIMRASELALEAMNFSAGEVPSVASARKA